jgi:hypothetical protein
MRSSDPGSGVGENGPGPTVGWPGSPSNASGGGGSAERPFGGPALKGGGVPALRSGAGSAGSNPPIGDGAAAPEGAPGLPAAGLPAAGDASSDPLLPPAREVWTSPLVPFAVAAIEPPGEPMPPPPWPPAAIALVLLEYDADVAERADAVPQTDILSADKDAEPMRAEAS